MTADELLQITSHVLYIVIFGVVAAKAVRRPSRTNVDIALLFGDLASIILASRAGSALGISSPLLTFFVSSLLMAIPYLTLRLVDDFSGVRPVVMYASAGGLALSVLALIVLAPPLPPPIALLMVAYFVAIEVYATVRFIRQARRSNGLTRRRMTAVAAGSLLLGLVILAAGAGILWPGARTVWSMTGTVLGLLAGGAYYIGFAPPAWLRRAWQEPELRAFLSQAASLPRLPTTDAIIRTLESGAATSLGAPHASIGLWDTHQRDLRFPTLRPTTGDTRIVEALRKTGREPDSSSKADAESPADAGPIALRAFRRQQSLFVADAPRADPAHAEMYRAFEATAVLAAPITAGEKRLGVLTVYAPRSPVFAEDDLMLVQLLADQAAVVLESRALIDEAARVQAREEATRLKDDFLSSAAHDLKTPLTTLLAQAQLMERRALRDPTEPPDLPGIQRLVAETRRLSALVLELLDASRVDQNRLVGQREVIDLAAVAREVCQHRSDDRHRCTIGAEHPVVGQYDRTRMAQLLENLIENAIKYSPDGGEVRVRVWEEGGQARLSVEDEGIGIASEDLPHIFERYQRGHNVDDRQFAGLGLGLYICQGIVEQHGGHIWATSDGPGKGAAFHVSLPKTAAWVAA